MHSIWALVCTSRSSTKLKTIQNAQYLGTCSRVHLDLVPNGFYQPMQQLLAAVVGVVAADFPGLLVLVLALVEVEVIPCTD